MLRYLPTSWAFYELLNLVICLDLEEVVVRVNFPSH